MPPDLLYIALSARESEVLLRFIRGELYKEIAQSLNISLATVMEHRDRIVLKTLIKGHRINMREVGWVRGLARNLEAPLDGARREPAAHPATVRKAAPLTRRR